MSFRYHQGIGRERATMLNLSSVVERTTAYNFRHPGGEVGSWLKLIDLFEGDRGGFLHDVLSRLTFARHAGCYQRQAAIRLLEMRSEHRGVRQPRSPVA